MSYGEVAMFRQRRPQYDNHREASWLRRVPKRPYRRNGKIVGFRRTRKHRWQRAFWFMDLRRFMRGGR